MGKPTCGSGLALAYQQLPAVCQSLIGERVAHTAREDTGENQGTFTTPAYRGRDHGGLPRSVFTSSQIELTDFPWSSSGLLDISSYNTITPALVPFRIQFLDHPCSCLLPPAASLPAFCSTPLSPPDHIPRFLESTSQPRPLQPQLLPLRRLIPRYLIPQVSQTVTAPSQEAGLLQSTTPSRAGIPSLDWQGACRRHTRHSSWNSAFGPA